MLITDEGLTDRKNAEVLQKVISYVQNGGIAIIGLHFPNFVTMGAMNDLFASLGCLGSAAITIAPTLSSIPRPFSLVVLKHLRSLVHSA